MNACVLFRTSREEELEQEFRICSSYLPTVAYRTAINPGSIVVGRYSVLPNFQELEEELLLNESVLVNNYEQHKYIADFEYYDDVKEFTPKTYFSWGDLPEGSYVVKGKTNSRKFLWNTHMFAKTKDDVPVVARRLLDDQFIEPQGLIVREYIPLKQFDIGINEMPVTNEWRFFFFGTMCLAHGYYWANFPEVLDDRKAKCMGQMCNFAQDVANIISRKVNFFVLDVAEKKNGGYTLIEVNDGQCSGLSMCDPYRMYRNLNISLLNCRISNAHGLACVINE